MRDKLAPYVRILTDEVQRVGLAVRVIDGADGPGVDVLREEVRKSLLNIADARRAQEVLDPTLKLDRIEVPGLHPAHLPDGMPLDELRRIRACVSLDG